MTTQRTVQVGYNNTTIPGSAQIDPVLVKATGENAQPTSRLLDGSEDHGYSEEWAEPATMPDGRKCHRMYLFDEDDISDDNGDPLDPESYPWDNNHVKRIILID